MDIPFDLLHIVVSFHTRPYMKLSDWIERINWNSLLSNPNAIYMLEANPHKVNWDMLLKNPNLLQCNTSFGKIS